MRTFARLRHREEVLAAALDARAPARRAAARHRRVGLSTVFCDTVGIEAFHRELIAKRYGYGRPGLEQAPWGQVLEVHDPFGNRIRFCEPGPTG